MKEQSPKKAIKITVALGEETYAPVSYNSFHLGELKVEFEVECKDADEVQEHISATFERLMTEREGQFQRCKNAYFARLRELGKALREK